MHRTESGQLPSGHLLVDGDFVVWTILPKTSIKKLIKIWPGLRLKSGICFDPDCADGNLCNFCSCDIACLHTPSFFPNKDFLTLHGIASYDFIQRRGEMVFVGPGVGYAYYSPGFAAMESRCLLPYILGVQPIKNFVCYCPAGVGGRQPLSIDLPELALAVDFNITCDVNNCLTPNCESSAVLKKHRHQIHRPFACPDCDVNPPSASHLLAHQNSVHGLGTKIQCEPCGKPYTPKEMTRHVKTASHLKVLEQWMADTSNASTSAAPDATCLSSAPTSNKRKRPKK